MKFGQTCKKVYWLIRNPQQQLHKYDAIWHMGKLYKSKYEQQNDKRETNATK